MFGTLGGPEVILILVVALIVFGPRRLPEIGKSMGKMLAEFRKASNDFKRTIEDELEAEKSKESMPAIAPAPVTPVTTLDAPPSMEPVPLAEDASPPAPEASQGAEAAVSAAGADPASPASEPKVEPPAEPVVSRDRSSVE